MKNVFKAFGRQNPKKQLKPIHYMEKAYIIELYQIWIIMSTKLTIMNIFFFSISF